MNNCITDYTHLCLILHETMKKKKIFPKPASNRNYKLHELCLIKQESISVHPDFRVKSYRASNKPDKLRIIPSFTMQGNNVHTEKSAYNSMADNRSMCTHKIYM